MHPVRRSLFTALAILGVAAAASPQERQPRTDAVRGQRAGAPRPAATGPIYRIPVTGTIELGLAPFVTRALREARRAGARFAVLDIDTPGGRIDAAERIADAVRDAGLPVHAFVNRRALSAGALVALAADSIYVRAGSVIGAATPVSGAGQKLPEKYVSAMRAEFRALAEERGLDPRIAEAMVDEDLDLPDVKPKGQLLTLAAGEAVRLGVATAEVSGWDEMLSALGAAGAAGAAVVVPRSNWAEAVVRFASNPLVAPILLSLGVLGLIVEIKTPHFGLAGLAGFSSLALFFGSHWIIGLAGWEELILIGLGLIALLVEFFLLPGFGVAGVIGVVALGAGVFLSLLGSFPTGADVGQALGIMAVSAVFVFAVLIAFVIHLPSSRRLAGVLLKRVMPSAEGYVSAPARAHLVGATGVALSDLRPVGAAQVGEERLDVTTEGEFVPAGSPLTVVRAEGYLLVVRAARQPRTDTVRGQPPA